MLLCASNSKLQTDPILKHTFDDDSSSCIQINTVVPTQPYTTGQMIFLIVQTPVESICFDLCMCVLVFVFDHSDIRSCTFEQQLEFWKKKVTQGLDLWSMGGCG